MHGGDFFCWPLRASQMSRRISLISISYSLFLPEASTKDPRYCAVRPRTPRRWYNEGSLRAQFPVAHHLWISTYNT
jgi:hypothetical protein